MTDGFISVRNWSEFQHYKDRSPAWIKLHTNVLENYEFCTLPDETKAHLVLIWALASRMDNKIPNDAKWVGNRIGATRSVNLAVLINAGFLVPWNAGEARGKREDWPSRYVPDDVRAMVMERDGHKCRNCSTPDRLEIDHVIPISQGGTGAPANLQVLCVSCNRKKRSAQSRSKVSADATQKRSLETETETETETEKNSVPTEPAPSSPSMADPPFAMPPEPKPASTSPLDLKAEMWRRGKAFLVSRGVTEHNAGSLLGKWRKLVGDVGVINLLARAEAECASEPIAWIEGALKSDAKRSRAVAQQDPAATVADRRAAMLRAVGMADGMEVGERPTDTGPRPRQAAGTEAGGGACVAPGIGAGISGGARPSVGVRGNVRPAGGEDRGSDEDVPRSADGHTGRRAGERDQTDDRDVELPLSAAAGGHPEERERGIVAPAVDPVAHQDRGDVRPVADDLTRDPWVLYERLKRKELTR